MTEDSKKKVKKVAKTGVRTARDMFFLILKIIGAVFLTIVTTGIIFMCIFAIYVKTNLSTELDVKLEDYSMSLSSVICYVDPKTGLEQEMVTLQSTEFRIWIDYYNIPKYIEQAAVAIEDQRFYKHHGVDWFRTSGAFVNMFLSMKNTFGGSTITQQLIKNLTDEDDVTVQRKLTEIFRALELEKNYDKDEIIELYLNLIYFGHGCYGIGAAAEYYFGKDVSELTLAESASIVGITNNPSIYSPYVSRENNKTRQKNILMKMLEQGFITEIEYRSALREELNFRRGENNKYENVVYTWFEEAVIRDVINDLMEQRGISERMANYLLFYSGYKIIATIDTDMQAKVDSIYQNLEEIPETRGTSKQLQSSIVITDPYTGEIKALSGGVGEKTGNMLLNRATMTRRAPGSSIKPLSVYAPAIDYGLITPDTYFDDSEYVVLEGAPTYKPKNYDRRYRGLVRIRYAVQQSLNTISAQVLDKLMPSVSYRFLIDTLGFELDAEDEGYAALALGQLNYGATVREMASGYTMFPNMGERMKTYTYTKVYDASGAVILENRPSPVSAISETTAYWMTDLLIDVVNNGTGGAAKLSNMPTAGKTGSTTENKDRWFAGYTPYYVAVVWTGYDQPEEIVLRNSSGNPAAQIWKKVMTLVHEDLPEKEFVTPPDIKLSAVPGVTTAGYTVICIDTEGNVLSEKTSTLAVGRTITEYAPELEGYMVTGDAVIETAITNDSSQNVAQFVYMQTAVGEPSGSEPQDNDPPGNANNPDGTPIQTEEPVQTETPTQPETPAPENSEQPETPEPSEPAENTPVPEEPSENIISDDPSEPGDSDGNPTWLWID